MAISIDYNTNIIFVPKTYTQFVSIDPQTGLEIRQISLTTFAQDLADLQDDPEGAWAPTAFQYTAPISVGGVQLAPVVVILSPYIVEFEDGQYAVQLNGANTNVQDKVVVNQVSIRPNNSAGLTFSDSINSQSFTGAMVWVDSIDGEAGTQFPRGTPPNAVNNVTDAITIAIREGLHKFHVGGSFVATGNVGIDRYYITAQTPADGVITASNLLVDDSGFERISIGGSISGYGAFYQCFLGEASPFTGVQGIFQSCIIKGNITLDASATMPIIFTDCSSGIAGTSRPILNCNSTAAGINFRRYAGGLAVTNFNNASGSMTLDLMGADVSIDSNTCTAGELVVRGNGRLTDENGNLIANGDSVINGGLSIRNLTIFNGNVDATAVVDNTAIAEAVWNQLTANNVTPSSTGTALNEIIAKLMELWQIQGLDSSNPLTITETQRVAGTVDLAISGDGETTSIVTRQ
jgi:hypothetical protein